MVITIDGYSCQGKTHIGKCLADMLGIEFLSTGNIVRFTAFLYNEFNNYHSDKHATWMHAVEVMHKTSIREILACPYLNDPTTEKSLKNAAADPCVFDNVVKKIIEYAQEKDIVLDGRFTYELFPKAYRNYYFYSSIKRRALIYANANGISFNKAVDYIKFRDSFEKSYFIPAHVKQIYLDDFSTTDDILQFLKKDLITKG